MNKIICDVCGTSYPDTAAQCPICGFAQSVSARSAPKEAEGNQVVYSRVKGGRFSKRNVKKRNKAAGINTVAALKKVDKTPQKERNKEVEKIEKKENKPNRIDKGLLVVAFVLTLAIVAIIIYIAVRFFGITLGPANDSATDFSTQQSTLSDYETTGADLSCISFTLNKSSVEFISEGQVLLLNVKTVPADTTDPVTFSSSDESVATVTSAGRIMAIAPGEATVSVTCGNVTQNVKVVCSFEAEETLPEKTTTPTGTLPNEEVDLKINRSDVTFSYYGEKWQLFSGGSGKELVKWTSDDEKVVTVEDGLVIGVGPGTATVTAEYNGEKVTCIFRCSFTVPEDATDPPLSGDGFDTGISEEGGGNWDDNAVG